MSQTSSNKTENNQTVVSSGSMSRRSWPGYLKWLVPLIVLVIVVIVVLTMLPGGDKSGSGNKVSDTESSLLAKATTAINNYGDLSTIAGDIAKQPNYEKDPNYLYVLATYHININDPAVAEDYLSQLNKAYDPSVGYAKSLQQVTTAIPAKQLMKQAKSMQTTKGRPVKASGLGG